METIVLVIHLLIAIALVGVVLLQRSEGGLGGLGGGGGSGGGMGGLIGNRTTANLLTRATAVLAAAFMATSIGLAILAGNTGTPGVIVDEQPGTETPAAPAEPAEPATPSVPTSE